MAGDDILWKNVEAMKTTRPPQPKEGPSRAETSPESPPAADKPSPSSRDNSLSPNGESDPTPTPNGSETTTQSTETVRPGVPDAGTQSDRANGRSADRAETPDAHLLAQVPGRPSHRRPERYSFQYWADQITRLKKLRQVLNMARDPDDRTELALSDLVRTAVDEYLDRQTRPTDRRDPSP